MKLNPQLSHIDKVNSKEIKNLNIKTRNSNTARGKKETVYFKIQAQVRTLGTGLKLLRNQGQ